MEGLRQREKTYGSGTFSKSRGTSDGFAGLPDVIGSDIPISGGGYGTFWSPSSNWINSFTPQGGSFTPMQGRERCVDEYNNALERFIDNADIHKPSFSLKSLAFNAAIADVGREFWVKRETATSGHAGRQTVRRNRYLAKDILITNGDTWCPTFDDSWFHEDPRSKADPYGPECWSRYQPYHQLPGGIGQTVGELRELSRLGVTTIRDLPKFLKAQLPFFRELGNQYLNVEFGWKPYVKSVLQMYNLGNTLSKRIHQLAADNGKGVRRGGVFDTVDSTTRSRSTAVHLNPTGITYFQWNTGAHTDRVYTYNRKIWFSGRFRFFIPDPGDPFWKAKAILDVLGANPTPSLVYQLLPWSWLIDWFSNIGDVIDNLSTSAEVDMTADYAYVMMKTIERWTSTAHRQYATGWIPGAIPNPNPLEYRHATNTFTREEKIRIRADPFGFGVTMDSLSTRQWAILAALGVTHLPHTRTGILL